MRIFKSSNFVVFAKEDEWGFVDIGIDYGHEKHSQRLQEESVLPLVYWLLEHHYRNKIKNEI